jgi:hypothetical protein
LALHPEMRDAVNWTRETNLKVSGNPSLDGGKALTELMTNMVDALLVYACLRQIDPSTPSVNLEPCADLIVVLSTGSLWGRMVATIGEARNDC